MGENALPRIKAVLDREDIFGISAPKEQGGLADFECSDPGSFFIGRLSKSSVRKVGSTDISLKLDSNEDYVQFISSLRGFIPDFSSPTGYSDSKGNLCAVIPPTEILDEMRVFEPRR